MFDRRHSVRIRSLGEVVLAREAGAGHRIRQFGLAGTIQVRTLTPRLARGFLTKPLRTQEETSRAKTDTYAHKLYYQPSDYEVVNRLTEVAAARGVPNAQVALAWLLAQPGVTAPIIGATKPHHITDAIAALSLKLTTEEVKRLEEAYQPHAILGHA